MKWATTIVAALVAVLAFLGCSTVPVPAPTKPAKAVSPEESKGQVMRLFNAIQKEVGGSY